MNLAIDTEFPGGNVIVEKVDGFNVSLKRDLRDTVGSWFYWCFRVNFRKAGTYRFRFLHSNAIGTCGPAVSLNGAVSWQWLGPECVDRNEEAFTYFHRGSPDTVIFCVGMQYLQADLGRFLDRHSANPVLKKDVLCMSRQGREVEVLRIGESVSPKWRLLLTSRHHCCEMMATHVMEGFLEKVLENSTEGKKFREKFELHAVPFADKDGVENGDQGKNRKPHDHARDYGPDSIYPEVAAIKKLVKSVKSDIILDLHCPWLKGGKSNEKDCDARPSFVRRPRSRKGAISAFGSGQVDRI